jgi:hypothetical protein
VALGGAHPAASRKHHGDRFARHDLRLGDRLRRGPFDEAAATVVAVLLGIRDDLVAHQALESRLARQDLHELVALRSQLRLLAADLHLLELREVSQLGLEDGLGLGLGEPEARDQRRLRLVLVTDDADHLVEVEVGDEQAVEDVQPRLDLLEAVREPPRDRVHPEREPLLEQRLQPHHARAPVAGDQVQVDAVAALEVGGREQVRHHLLDVHPVRARRDHEARRVLVVGLVAQVLDHGQLLGAHLRRNLLEHLGAGDLVREFRDDDLAVLGFVTGPGAERAVAGLVDPREFLARRDDLRAGRQVRAPHVLEQLGERRLGLLEQPHAGGGDFAQVVRRDVGGHADRDAGRAVEQHVRQPRRQQRGLVERAVEVGRPVHRAVAELREQHLRVARQLRLGVAHRRERLRVVRRAEVALSVDDRVAVRERLRHQHQRLVAGRVAVRVELADHVADRARRFLVLGGGGEPELAHCVDDASLHGLQAVADVRERPVENHVHRVLEVRLLGEGPERQPLDPLEIQFVLAAHALPSALTAAPRPGCPWSRATRGGRPRASSRASCPSSGRPGRRPPR